MSKIIATDHFETQTWEVIFEDLDSNYADLFIGFTDDAPIIEFKDLKFKYELRKNGEIKQCEEYPPPNTEYVRTDQPYIVAESLYLQSETEYELYLWAENGGQEFEHTVSFTTPRPEQPYPSWEWDGEQWQPPVAYPNDDEQLYNWDEVHQNWIAIEYLDDDFDDI